MSLTARLRRLELARHAAVTAKPTPEEMRSAALSGLGRPVVLDMLAKMRAFAASLEPWTNAHKL